MKGGKDHFNTIIAIIYYIIKTTNNQWWRLNIRKPTDEI
jgi:hypothetical protein